MYRRRLIVFLLIIAAVTLGYVVRLASLQLGRGDEFRAKAQRVLSWGELLPTVRGTIYDRNNQQLAADVSAWDFCLDFNMLTSQSSYVAKQVRKIARQAKPRGELSGADLDKAQELYRQKVEDTWKIAEETTGVDRNRLSAAVDEAVARTEEIRQRVGPVKGESQLVIIPALDDAVAQKLRARLDDMVGASVVRSHKRQYFAGRLACHVIGTMGPVSTEERQAAAGADSSLRGQVNGYLAGDHSGKSGVEKLCEDMLRGRRGYRTQRRSGEEVEEIPVTPGSDVHLTLDIEMEKALSEVLAKSQPQSAEPVTGSIVVIDVPTGQVLAMVSLPDYDINDFYRNYAQLDGDKKYLPMINRSVAVRYPPGSTNKVLAALAALSCGAINQGTSFICAGSMNPAKPNELRCLGHHGTVSLLTGIQHSCNVYFYNVGRVLGVSRFDEFLTQLNYTEKPGCLLPEERHGILPADDNAQRSEAIQMGIGQGRIAVTPLHVASAMATIARGGEFRTPIIVQELADRQQSRKLNIPPLALAAVMEGMRMVVNSPGGTAYSTAHDDEIEISGKTGTATTPSLKIDSNGDGRADEVLRSGDTAWFAGYAPSRKPKIAFAIVVEYTNEHGGKACGPIARHVAHICKRLGYLDK